jgi:hypothetical protein
MDSIYLFLLALHWAEWLASLGTKVWGASLGAQYQFSHCPFPLKITIVTAEFEFLVLPPVTSDVIWRLGPVSFVRQSRNERHRQTWTNW